MDVSPVHLHGWTLHLMYCVAWVSGACTLLCDSPECLFMRTCTCVCACMRLCMLCESCCSPSIERRPVCRLGLSEREILPSLSGRTCAPSLHLGGTAALLHVCLSSVTSILQRFDQLQRYRHSSLEAGGLLLAITYNRLQRGYEGGEDQDEYMLASNMSFF